MNKWGFEQVPFLFIVDFEMECIRLFRIDNEFPSGIRFSTPLKNNNRFKSHQNKSFDFRKYPVSFSDYTKAFDEVKKQILIGNSFLVNLTFPTRIETDLTLSDIFELSNAKFKLLVNNEFVVFSPESFVNIKDGMISSFPMKGTIRASEFDAEANILSNVKETAEHHTIVDLIRNDLSMVASEVTVKRFRYIEKISTHEGDILQVSSEIVGKLPENYYNRLGDILFKLLPAGSITGAPKKKTLEIIEQVEIFPRGYYTGIFGHFDGNNLESAVMIRFIENIEGELRFRSGGGITYNSAADLEYQELIDKVYVPIV